VSCVSAIAELQAILTDVRGRGAGPVGLVPTMGALHEGHLSLVRRARGECGFVVVSIFVNPTQFGPKEDFARYPRDLDRDLSLALEAGADLVFAPADTEMYLPGHSTWVDVEGLTEGLCGASRPQHFRGVCTVVAKLLNLCNPDRAYFGQKDAQQLAVIRRMVRDLNVGVDIVGCPIVREADGLAMSSRNVYLSPEQRTQASLLRKSLQAAEELVAAGERDAVLLQVAVRAVLAEARLGEVEYVVVVDAEDLQPAETIAGGCLIAVAVRFGKTRLIDNTLVRG
jgi:pantoate--beta-alanine ligase